MNMILANRKRVAKPKFLLDQQMLRETTEKGPTASYFRHLRQGMIGGIQYALRLGLRTLDLLGFSPVGTSLLKFISKLRLKNPLIGAPIARQKKRYIILITILLPK